MREKPEKKSDLPTKADEEAPTLQDSRAEVVRVVDQLISEGALPSAASKTQPDDKLLVVEGGGKYRLTRLIAEGGMGTVYEAVDIACRRKVAVKFFPENPPNPRDDLLRFVREAQITACLEHPNIMPVHELGYDEGKRVFYVMKLAEGKTLGEILVQLRAGGLGAAERYSLNWLLGILWKVCDAMAFAHSRGFIHRDLKPDNIIVGEFGEVLIADWGLAKAISAPGVKVQVLAEPAAPDAPALAAAAEESTDFGETDFWPVTLRGRAFGTLGFMAPEQAMGDTEQTGAASDVFSLGAMLYSLLTLHAPIREKDILEYVRIIRSNGILPAVVWSDTQSDVPARRYRLAHLPGEKVPSALSDIAMKAMAPEPEDRYASVGEFGRDIEDFQNGLVWELVVDSVFSRPNALEDWEITGGEHEIMDSELRIHSGDPQVLLLKHAVPGDVRIEFECRQEGAYLNDIGVFMSAMLLSSKQSIPFTGYRMGLGAYDNSANILMRADQQLWKQVQAFLARGVRYRIVAERTGDRLRLVVNGAEVCNVTDPDPFRDPKRGAVGLVSWGADNRFRRIRVFRRTAPLHADILDVADRQVQRGELDAARVLYRDVLESHKDPYRQARAQRRLETIDNIQKLNRDLPRWRRQLESAWPGAQIDLRADAGGLSVDISGVGATDLSPLQGLPVTWLYCPFNRITSLEPLRGMSLRALKCSGNPIASLEPLRGMPLENLQCMSCRISSLEPLSGMPLTLLVIARNQIEDLEPLRDMSLTFFCAFANRISDLSPLADMPITSMMVHGNPVTSLEPLRGLPISTLNCSSCRISDLDPLRGMSLTVLHCGQNEIASLAPLAGMPLDTLSCQNNRITSLLPLKGLLLTTLTCGLNPLANLNPFVASPPFDFLFDSATLPVFELEMMKTLWRRDFRHAKHARDIMIIQAFRAGDVQKLKSLAADFEGHLYMHIPVWLKWREARDACARLGGHLVTLSSMEENQFVASLFKAGIWCWMGLSVEQGKPAWVTSEPVSFTNYADPLQELLDGPKIFSGKWQSEVVPDPVFTFVIEWDE